METFCSGLSSIGSDNRMEISAESIAFHHVVEKIFLFLLEAVEFAF